VASEPQSAPPVAAEPAPEVAASVEVKEPETVEPLEDEPVAAPIVSKVVDDLPAAAQASEESAEAEPPAVVEEEEATASSASEQEEQSGSWFSRFKSGLRKTTQVLNTDIRDLFKQEGRLVDDDFLRELFEMLVKTDMGAGPSTIIRDRIKSEFRGRVLHMDDLTKSVKDELRKLMAQEGELIRMADSGPTVVMVVGVNGSGKTTSIAKLANAFKSQGMSVVLGAGDTFRAAAVAQLAIWAERIGVDIVKGEQGSDPASVAHRAVAKAIETGADVCIIDTAGRLQTQTNLMTQLTKIRRVVSNLIEDAPHEVLLVLDATAGQNGISQAKGFSEAVECTGIVLAKLDGSAKGGVVVPIRQQFDLPVKFIGVGEQPEDMVPFDPEAFIEALFEEARTTVAK